MANDLTAFNAEVWSAQLVRNLDQINVMKGLVNTDWEGDLSQSKTVHVRTLGNVSLSAYTKYAGISYQDLVPSVETMTVADSQYFAFEVDDVDKAQTDMSVLGLYTRRAAVGINNIVESKILSAYTGALAGNQITATAGAALTLDSSTTQTGDTRGIYPVITQLAEKLSNQNVPELGRWLVVNPSIRTLLWNDTAHFVRASDLGDRVVLSGRFDAAGNGTPGSQAPGFIGTICGFDVYMVTHLPTSGGSKFMVAGNRDFVTYAAQLVEVEAIRLQTHFANAVRGLLLHDVKVFTENAKCGATAKFA